MSHFKTEQFKIEDESKEIGKVRVVSAEAGSGPEVKAFELPELQVQGKRDYGVIKSKYGALAATDADRQSKNSRDSRFSVNPLLRGPLAIEDEERRVIEKRVQDHVHEIAEHARAEGRKEGYEAGLKKGRDEAYAEFAQKASASLESFQSFVQSFEGLKNEIFKANERFLMEVIFRVARMIALKDISADPEYVIRLSRELVDRVGIRDNIKIRIHPKDAASIETLKAELLKGFPDLKNVAIETSEEVEGGGCAIETQWSAIDASIETQLNGLHAALAGGAPKNDP